MLETQVFSPEPISGVHQVPQSKSERRHRRWPWIVGGVVGLYFVWCIVTPIRWTSSNVQRFAGGVEIHTIALHELCAWWGIEGVIVPFPLYHVDDSYSRVIFRNGNEWFPVDGLTKVYPSPSGAYVAVQPFSKDPIRIYKTVTGESIDVPVDDDDKEFPGHYFEYPFRFLNWADDTGFLVEVTGTDWNLRDAHDYRQVWRIDAASGQRMRVE